MIKGVNRPAWDETFPTWLYRITMTRSSSNYHAFSIALKNLISHSPASPIQSTTIAVRADAEEVDIDYDQALIQEVISTWLPRFNILSANFLPQTTLVVPYSMRNHYCPICLREDISILGFPYWRKKWSYCLTAYCLQHKQLLVLPAPSQSSYDRAWQAFKAVTPEQPAASAFKLLRDRLAMRMQRWYFMQPGFSNQGIGSTKGVMEFFELTYLLLLKRRTRFEDGGYACSLARGYQGQMYQSSLTLSERISTGVNVSTAVQRAYALILVGIILGLLPEEQISSLSSLARHSGVPWPRTSFEIGQMAISYAHRDEYLELRRLYSLIPAHLVDRCSEYFRGLERGVHTLRDEHSLEDREWLETGAPHLRWAAVPPP